MAGDGKAEQYLLLAKNAKGLALVDLINKATAEPGVLSFGELLSLPATQELRAGEHQQMYSLLELFAYGTWDDYTARSGKYPALGDKQKLKLKVLTIVTMANQRRTIPYDNLLSRLALQGVRELEDLIIGHCFYTGTLRGKLDQRSRCLHVEDAFCRDVRPEDLPHVIASLGGWLQNATALLGDMESRVKWTADAEASAAKRRSDLAVAVEAERRGIQSSMDMQARQDASSTMVEESDAFNPGPAGPGEDGGRPPGGRHTKRRR